MIDIKKAEEEFIRYTNQYDKSVFMLDLKFHHSFRVERLCGRIAESLGLQEEQVKLAKLIGLLHDIARFEQYIIYGTLKDRQSIDHGDFGVEVLEKNEYLRQYILDTQYDEVIKKAIRNHNKLYMEEGLSEEEKLFCKIIRDADKLDIYYLATTVFWRGKEDELSKQRIADKVFEQIINGQIVKNESEVSELDSAIKIMAYLYDIHFTESYRILYEQDYINQIINRFNYQNEETRKRMEQIKKQVNEDIKIKKEE